MNQSQSSQNYIPNPPRGIRKIPWRLPIWIYRLRLGWIFGHRAILLIHKGRNSGKIRYAVLEVIKFEKASNVHYVASGFGGKSDWFQNIVKHPHVNIRTAGKTLAVKAQVLDVDGAQTVFNEYTDRHPNAIKNLVKFIGYNIGDSHQDTLEFLRMIPVISFNPVD